MQKYNACTQLIVHSSNVQHLSAKALYIHDLQYTRNTVITKDWTYDEINSHVKHYKKILIQHTSFEEKVIVCSGRKRTF